MPTPMLFNVVNGMPTPMLFNMVQLMPTNTDTVQCGKLNANAESQTFNTF